MRGGLARACVLALLLPAVGGCAVVAVTGAVVGAGVSVASSAVSAGVAVGKGVASVASAPFRAEPPQPH
jgi:hypothetical protein